MQEKITKVQKGEDSDAGSCPVGTHPLSGKATEFKSFHEIPGPKLWPVLGTLPDLLQRIDAKHLGMMKVWQEWYSEYGTVVREKLVSKDQVNLFHPDDALALYRAEGQYPDGAIRITWPVLKYSQMKKAQAKDKGGNVGVYGLVEKGPEWKDMRMRLNPGLFSPKAAEGYYPLLNRSSASISASLPDHTDDLLQFANLAVFDLFCSAILGKDFQVTKKSTANPRDIKFALGAQEGFQAMGKLIMTPWENIAKEYNIETAEWRKFVQIMDNQHTLGVEIVKEIKAEGIHPDSYLSKLTQGGDFDDDQVATVVGDLLSAAVDTTGSTLFWLLYDIARHPEQQDRLHRELNEAFQGGDFNPDQETPLYLKACYRESQRYSPIGAGGSFRTAPSDIVLGGYMIPKGTHIMINGNAIQNDKRYVDRPEEFIPERWLPEAVTQRKGTEAEILDNKLLASIFGFGPRMCLGARLAKNEIFSVITRIVQDWEISVDRPHERKEMKLLLQPVPAPSIKLRRRQLMGQ
eukprot:gnl/MRDRNA2_/MRDRNA2_72466_c0_seq1.p1 gnl/MRDRNA2_/MRDRNA2_72466_c0~~gnl/MRDRNA2_/MRDRNA2_72466_c0_seq1.p1  ORF type:complete len:585 (-),score=96.94 gnl/MRDRNA2_/MRDRNA2_72466_c0_seq1:272-1825(-)